MQHNILWFRRDLRLHDNNALSQALQSAHKVIPIFIFDTNILDKLEDKKDARVQFIFACLDKINIELKKVNSHLSIYFGKPQEVIQELIQKYNVAQIFTNEDYEPYALKRDAEIEQLCNANNCVFSKYKDHVIFAKNEITKDDGLPYTVFTPYSKKWKAAFSPQHTEVFKTQKYFNNFSTKHEATTIKTLADIGFEASNIKVPHYVIDKNIIANYHNTRDFPSIDGTTQLGVHLRFGTVSVREVITAASSNEKYLNEIIWRDFYQQILWHFPHVIGNSFKAPYDNIQWRNNETEFEAWCTGHTGYPIVDAGMRQLNATGWMHNRIRMMVASFLAKHLLIDWRWGEAYFAKKLLDFDLASNNGGWQWAAGSGVDAAPYFRIFSPKAQTEKFDNKLIYIRKWVPEFDSLQYVQPIVDHTFARERCLKVYKAAVGKTE
jgi:deoxyribodipyrimidine photo-lyase